MTDLTDVKVATISRGSDLLSKSYVVAAGVGRKITNSKHTGTPAVICSVIKKMPKSQLTSKDLVPSMIDGIPTDVIETGVIRAFKTRTDRWRPAPGGVSIGHVDITAGTLGCRVEKGGKAYILSNNHVLANSNEAAIGSEILQPGKYDGGSFPSDYFAKLTQFIPIEFGDAPSPCSTAEGMAKFLNWVAKVCGSKSYLKAFRKQDAENLVDAAIARPLEIDSITPDILDIGIPQGITEGMLDMPVKKSGRTTGLTLNFIIQTDVMVDVNYGNGRIARFIDQLMAGAMSQPGDSGSVVLTQADNLLVGLLFAGSDNTTIINRIEHVFNSLGVSL